MPEQQDLVVHSVEHTLGDLQKHRGRGRSPHGCDQQGATLRSPGTSDRVLERDHLREKRGGSVGFVVENGGLKDRKKGLRHFKPSDSVKLIHTRVCSGGVSCPLM